MARKLVLIVEDDAAIRDVLSELLDLEGYDIQIAQDGREALNYLTHPNRMPNIILLDLMMPVCSGFEFLRLLKTSNPHLSLIPIVIMSAAVDAAETAKEYGTELIRKPLDANELLGLLTSLWECAV